jgi:hypothetical protein
MSSHNKMALSLLLLMTIRAAALLRGIGRRGYQEGRERLPYETGFHWTVARTHRQVDGGSAEASTFLRA